MTNLRNAPAELYTTEQLQGFHTPDDSLAKQLRSELMMRVQLNLPCLACLVCAILATQNPIFQLGLWAFAFVALSRLNQVWKISKQCYEVLECRAYAVYETGYAVIYSYQNQFCSQMFRATKEQVWKCTMRPSTQLTLVRCGTKYYLV